MTHRRPLVALVSAAAALVLGALGLGTVAGPASAQPSGHAAGTASAGALDGVGPMANPIVTDIHTADPATLVVDGTAYLFTGRDEAASGQQQFVMREWHAFSSRAPSNDPEAWEHHGVILLLDTFDWAGANAWASEVVEGPDGRFYWFVSVDGNTDNGWMNIGVAVADHPLGPYRNAIGGPLISDSTPTPAGPWTHRGVVLGQVSSTTNHPAIMEFGDQWFMVYHTADAPGGGDFRRSVAIDELFFNSDGTMRKVVQTP